MRLGEGREFDLIRSIASRLGPRARGLGDDCAVIPFGGTSLVLTTDLTVQDVHYRNKWLTPAEAGRRATSAALSDLAAAGADALGVLASVAGNDEDELAAIMDGVGEAVESAGTVVLGGDLSRSDCTVIDICCAGSAPHPLSRRGARPGDGLWVTGSLGAARAALYVLQSGGPLEGTLRVAFANPSPRLAAGRWLAANGARAMLDLSDGLASDLTHLAARSQVGVAVELSHLPVAVGVEDVAANAGEEPAVFAARGGEDYELLAALPGSFGSAEAAAFRQSCNLTLTRIGEVTQGTGVTLLLDGEPRDLKGFDHFR